MLLSSPPPLSEFRLLRTAADIPVFSAEKRENPLMGLGRIWQQTSGKSNILAKLESRLKFCCKIISQKYKKDLAIKRMEQREKYFYYAAFASSITDKADFS